MRLGWPGFGVRVQGEVFAEAAGRPVGAELDDGGAAVGGDWAAAMSVVLRNSSRVMRGCAFPGLACLGERGEGDRKAAGKRISCVRWRIHG